MKKVQIGNVAIGGGEKISVQSMTNVKTKNYGESCKMK